MSSGTNHIMGGLVVWLLAVYASAAYLVGPKYFIVTLICTLAGALFPDIDIKSKGQKLFYGFMAPAYIILFARGYLLLCFLIGLFAVLPMVSHHRGIFHRWWFLMFLAGLWGLAVVHMFPLHAHLGIMGTIFFVLGFFSHLWLDFGLLRMFFK